MGPHDKEFNKELKKFRSYKEKIFFALSPRSKEYVNGLEDSYKDLRLSMLQLWFHMVLVKNYRVANKERLKKALDYSYSYLIREMVIQNNALERALDKIQDQ